MDWWLLTFFIGAILSLFLPIVPDFSYVFFLTILIVVFLFFKNTRKLVGLLLGVTLLLFQGANYNQTINENSTDENILFQQPLLINGDILSLINANDKKDNIRFNFQVLHINEQALEKPFIVRLSWKKPLSQISQEQKWQLWVKLKPAHGIANQGAFHYQKWLRQHQIVATGYVKNSAQNILLNDTPSIRQQWFNKTQTIIGDKSFSAFFYALTFGVRDHLTKADWRVLQLTGTQHLLAISGLHVGMVAGMSFWLCTMLIKCLPLHLFSKASKLALSHYNYYHVIVLISLSIAVFYSYLAGFSAPTLRALIMLMLYWGTRFFSINISKSRLLLLTVFIIICCQPMSLLGAGFWLSLYAVSMIFFLHWLYQHFMQSRYVILGYIKSLVLIQIGLSLFILPVAAILQFQLPLLAILANFIAIPFLSLIVLPITLLAFVMVVFDIPWFIYVVEWSLLSIELLISWLDIFTTYPSLMINIGWPIILSLFILLSLLVFCLLKPNKQLFPFVLLFLSLLIWHLNISSKANHTLPWKVHILDVGQGLAIVIQRGKHVIVYDTGASYSSGFIMAESVINPFLKSQGIEKIDQLYISHSDNDHAGGLAWLTQHITIEELIFNDIQLTNKTHIKATRPCLAPSQVIWQGLTISTLWPKKNKGAENDESCVLKVSDSFHQVLLTGDISRKVEKELINTNDLSATLLVAPHHGSNTSSSSVFINSVQPEYVVFSAGFMNRWRMPTKKVIGRYKNASVNILSTAESGMISFTFTGDLFLVSEYKKHQYPFWFAN